MPEVNLCALCFEKVDRAEEEYVVWQKAYDHHAPVIVHADCAKTHKRRPKAFDFDK